MATVFEQLEKPASGAVVQSGSKQEFMVVYETLRNNLLVDDLLDGQPEFARQHLRQVLDYNVPGGKLNRGMTVAAVLRELKKEEEITSEEVFRANALGWCIEWLQAFFLVADDIMDNSITRRGQPCWFRLPQVGLVACNDYIILESCIYRILAKHFARQPYYGRVLELFHETTHQTAHGQLLDIMTAPIGTVDLSKYTLETYMRIVTFKTAFYSFYLPVACGLLVGGVSDMRAFALAKKICLQMGQYFQIQDDFLDCYGDPDTIGKIGTDIQDNKCSWLVVQALQRATAEQTAIIRANYGKDNEAAVARVKGVYTDLGLANVYEEYEAQVYEELRGRIEEQKLLPRGVFLLLLDKIHKRLK